jgi:hypothetical protein
MRRHGIRANGKRQIIKQRTNPIENPKTPQIDAFKDSIATESCGASSEPGRCRPGEDENGSGS